MQYSNYAKNDNLDTESEIYTCNIWIMQTMTTYRHKVKFTLYRFRRAKFYVGSIWTKDNYYSITCSVVRYAAMRISWDHIIQIVIK